MSEIDQPRDAQGKFAAVGVCDCGHTAGEHDIEGDLSCLVPECDCEEYEDAEDEGGFRELTL